mgnify:CR=1 FL=1
MFTTLITCAQLQTLQRAGASLLIIDCTADLMNPAAGRQQFLDAHIPGAIHLGKGILERDIEKHIPDTDAEIVLYCGGGYRSALAADNLQKMGYTNVKSMNGGFRGWKDAGLPIESP